MLPSALPPPAGVWASAAPVTANVSTAARASVFIDMAFSFRRIDSVRLGLNITTFDIVQALNRFEVINPDAVARSAGISAPGQNTNLSTAISPMGRPFPPYDRGRRGQRGDRNRKARPDLSV